MSNNIRNHEEDKKPNLDSTHITLKVINQGDHEMYFRVKRSSQLKELMMGYCVKMNLEFGTFPFLFDGNRIRPHQTPDELEMEDGDEIEAFHHMLGGWRGAVDLSS